LEDVKEATLTVEVVAAKDDAVELKFSGRARLEGANKRIFVADLLGKATWRPKTVTFSSFELLAIGTHTMGGAWENIEDGSPRTAPMGVLFTLSGKNANDQMAPALYQLYSWAE
jgi:hypothetical protein